MHMVSQPRIRRKPAAGTGCDAGPVKAPPVPFAFAESLLSRAGPAGRAWLDELPGTVSRNLARWRLAPDGEPLHGQAGVVYPVVRADGTPAMLKVSWPDAETRDEHVALAAWAGEGAVLLLDHAAEDGALLLERLDSRRMLTTEPIDRAVPVAGRLLRRQAIAAPPLYRTLPDEARRWAETLPAQWERLGRPLPRELLDLAVDVCRERGPAAANLLVNEDLHYANVLAGAREPWLTIDPKPIAGDLEFGTIPLLWNRMGESTLDERFAAVVEGADLDHALAREWTLVRAVVNWLWAVAGPGGTGPDAGDFVLTAVRRIAPWAAG